MGKYIIEMIEHMPPDAPIRWYLYGDRPDTQLHVPENSKAIPRLFDVRGYRYHLWEQLSLPRQAQRDDVHLLHCTGTTLPWYQPIPVVVTVHDILPWLEPTRGYERWYLHRLMPHALARAAAIITISTTSRNDILQHWPTLAPKLHVIPHGISDRYLEARPKSRPPVLDEALGSAAYVLYIGGSLPRKRFDWAVEVLRRSTPESLRMVACGFSAEEGARTLERLQPSMRERIALPSYVDEQDMPALYQNAVAVLYPTLYEGFGLPVLEAQAVGTPVLFSALGSLRELAGPIAQILPPDDMDAWVQTVSQLAQQRYPGAPPADLDRAWARSFSWNISSARHLDVYRSAIQNVSH